MQYLNSIFKTLLICIGLMANNTLQASVNEYQFDNGLKLLVKEDHRAPVVVSMVWYRVGSSYEREGITGVSHALEHMMFKGTKNYASGEFSRIISENGGRENAFTSRDYTAYFQTLEKSRLPISFELEADRMRNLLLNKDEFSKEIEVIKEERRWRTDDNPQSYTGEVSNATSFQTSPYRHPVIGWMHDLDTMNIDVLSEWYKKWYAPNNAIVVVTGDVKAEEVYQLAQKYFAPLPAEDIHVLQDRPEVDQAGIKRVTVKRPAEVPYLMMSYKVPSVKSAMHENKNIPEWEPYALEVLAAILDGGDSARFNSRLVRGTEIATSINTSYSMASRLDNLFVFSAVPSQGYTLDDLENAIKNEISEVKQQQVTAAELDRVKTQVVANDVYEKDSVFYQALVIGTLETVGLSWKLADEYVEKINNITAEQVQAVAKKYLVDDGLTVARLNPLPLDGKANRRPAGGIDHVR